MRFDFVPPPPTYPEYEELRARAAVIARRPVDPRGISAKHGLAARYDWCLAVLGRPCHGLGYISSVDAELLVLADEAGINPPLPSWVLEERAAAERARAERDARAKAVDDAMRARWDEARARCQVEVEVRRNGHARAHHGGRHQLGHVVPKVDARSGKSRRHSAGRALCESERRARPLDLSGGEGGPATCVRCLDYTPKIRPAAV